MKSLNQGVKEYIEYRSRLGFNLRGAKRLLFNFIAFIKQRGKTHITTELALAFATINPNAKSSSWVNRLGTIRQFAKYWSSMDPKTEIPPVNLIRRSNVHLTPYIYSGNEIIQLLKSIKTNFNGELFDRYTYFVLFGLLAVTGMSSTAKPKRCGYPPSNYNNS